MQTHCLRDFNQIKYIVKHVTTAASQQGVPPALVLLKMISILSNKRYHWVVLLKTYRKELKNKTIKI